MPTGELHVQLAVTFPDNRKVRRLVRFGRDARALRDLYVQMLLYCKGTLSDGFVPDEQIGLLVYPDTDKNGQRDAGRLAEVELCERDAGGWRITGWFDRNPSRDDVRQKSAAKADGARLANHRRWHVEYGNTDPRCKWCQSADQTTDKTTDQNADQSGVTSRIGAAKRSDSTETESYTESESESEKEQTSGQLALAVRVADIGSDADPDFAAFWGAYPRKAAKGAARKAWRTAVISKKTAPVVIIAAAEQFRDDPARRAKDPTLTPHPATWLNGERWLERYGIPEADPARGYSNNPWDN